MKRIYNILLIIFFMATDCYALNLDERFDRKSGSHSIAVIILQSNPLDDSLWDDAKIFDLSFANWMEISYDASVLNIPYKKSLSNWVSPKILLLTSQFIL